MALWKDFSVEVDDGASSAYTVVPSLLKFEMPEQEAEAVAEDPAFDDDVKPYAVGLIEPGNAAFEIDYLEAQLTRFEAHVLAGTAKNLRIVYPPGGTGAVIRTYACFFTKAFSTNKEGPNAQKKIRIECKITGVPTVGTHS